MQLGPAQRAKELPEALPSFEAEHCPFMLMLQATKRLSLRSGLPELRKGLFTTGLLAVPCVGGGRAGLKKGLPLENRKESSGVAALLSEYSWC